MISVTVLAAGINFQEAIRHGLKKNNEIKDIEKKINNIERDLLSLKARQDWQVDIAAFYNESFSEKDSQLNNLGTQNRVSINIVKTIPSGLTIQPVISFTGEELEPEFAIEFSHTLLPSTPTELEKQIYRKEKELFKARENLLQQKISKIISWLESYLNLTRMTEKQEIYKQTVNKAKNNLKEVQKKIEIDEAGKGDLLTARISLENANYTLIETEKRIEEVQMSFYQALGLKEPLIIDDKSDYLVYLRNRVEELITAYTRTEKLMNIIKDKNYDLLVNRIDRESIKKEIEWAEKEGKTSLNISGGYNTDQDELSIGLNLSHQLYDGGERELGLEKKEIELNNNLEQYNDIYNQLEIKLKQYLNTVELSELKLKKDKISLEKSRYELEVGQKQLDMGLIGYLECQELWLNRKETEINIKSILDQLLLDKINLIKFINIDKLQGVFQR